MSFATATQVIFQFFCAFLSLKQMAVDTGLIDRLLGLIKSLLINILTFCIVYMGPLDKCSVIPNFNAVSFCSNHKKGTIAL